MLGARDSMLNIFPMIFIISYLYLYCEITIIILILIIVIIISSSINSWHCTECIVIQQIMAALSLHSQTLQYRTYIHIHWLQAREQITLKLCLLVYKAINGLAPPYLQDLCVPITTVSTSATLRSTARGDLVVPHTRQRLGNRAFCVALTGPTAWNSLPSDIRSASSVTTFKNIIITIYHSPGGLTGREFDCQLCTARLVYLGG